MALSLRQLEDERAPLLRSRAEAASRVAALQGSLADSVGAEQVVTRMALDQALRMLAAIDETLTDLGAKIRAAAAEEQRLRAHNEAATAEIWDEYEVLAKEIGPLAEELAKKRARCSALAAKIWGYSVRRAPDPVAIVISRKANVEAQTDVKIQWERS